MLSLAFISFIAGILTILAPCVLPVLPVILAGSLTEKKKWYPYVVTFSLAFSIVLFTFLLKVSTLFLDISPSFWKYFSGMILVFLGCIYIFPHIWTNIGIRFGFSRSSNTLDSAQDIANPLFRAIVTGTALGPVFSSCSPTYTLLLATVFPVSLVSGVFYTAIYALGLSFILLIITIFGTSVIKRLKVFADERGLFRRFLGIILLLVGLLIFTGVDKKIETYLVTHYDVNSIETGIIKKISPNHPIIMNTEQKTMIGDTASSSSDVKMERAYFAGGCFWCMEGIFEAQAGVKEAISGYAGGEQKDANYDTVSSGNTKHREAVEVIYDPSRIRFETLVDLYYTQIDPTQVDGQFADRGYQYTTAIYYKNEEEKKIIENAKKVLQDSKKFEKPIAVQTVPFTTFFPAEDHHQDYYKKSAFRYSLYKSGSGRAGFIEKNGQTGGTLAPAEIPKKSQYRPYNEQELQTLGNTQILLFFHAEWCSTCQNFDKQISETSLPENLVIYQVDYDSATELKKKYSILSQSTWVQVDSTGKAYKRWLGKSQLSDILSDLVSVRDILSQKLTPLQFEVTQMGATERPFDNAYWDNHEPGIYVDIVDGTPLFSSTDKFDSGTGWPSFSRPISESILSEHLDTKLEQNRTEVKSTGGSHLGHVFNDGPSEEGGLRYCINSAALRFIPVADLQKEGYGEYGRLFGSGFIQK